MTPVDVWAALAAGIAASAVLLRRLMLKPDLRTWVQAPPAVRGGLSALALTLGMRAVSICSGHMPANEGEATLYTVLAAVSVIMAWNLHATGREHRPPR